jgi:SseB protein C-terminal domain/SseB protein N-terminal domain
MFEPSNGLERLLIAAATEPAQRAAFSKAVLEAHLYVAPVGAPGEPGQATAVRSWRLENGTSAAAVFTSPERLEAAFEPGVLTLSRQGRVLLEWLRPGPVVLNPGHDYAIVWDAEALAGLLDGMVSRVVEKETEVRLGHPAQRPDELIARLSKAFSSDQALEEAYLLLMHGPAIGERGVWFVGVRTRGPWPAVQALVRQAVDGYRFDRPLDVMELDTSPVSATLRTGIPILAPRKRRGLSKFFRKD